MEVTKKVGGPDPSGPQGHPSIGSQQLGGGVRGSQGPRINSGSASSRHEVPLSTEANSDGAYGSASQAHTHEPCHQHLREPTEATSQCGYERASQDTLRLPSTSLFPGSFVGAQTHLVMETRTPALPVYTRGDASSDTAQHGLYCSRLQVQVVGEGKVPAKVLVGWGKGPCSPEQTAPAGIRKSRWLPYIPLGEDGSPAAQGPFLAPGHDQSQGKGPGPVQALPTPTPTRASTPGVDPISMAGAESYPCNPDHLTDTKATTKGLSQDLLPGKYGNQWPVQLDSSKGVTSCQNKLNFHPQEEPPTPAPTLNKSQDQSQVHEVTQRPVLPRHPKNQVEKPLVGISRPGSPKPGSGPPGTPKSQRDSQEIRSTQQSQQPLNVCNNPCSSRPPSACQLSGHNPAPVPPREAMQIPASSAPTCQLRDAVEDRVLVFDMATGNTRMGLLCHDPMGSRAVLVGLMPTHPPIYASESTQPTRPLPMPILTPDSDRSSFWSTTAVVSSPVPSSLSSGSYREVALVPKEARVHLESRGSTGAETPMRMGMLGGPVLLGTPLQFGERILSHAHDPGWSKPDAEKNQGSRTIWMLDAPGMQDTSLDQTKKQQWMSSEHTTEPVPAAKNQEVLRPPLQEDIGSHNQKESCHPDSPQVKRAGQAPLGGQPPLAEQAPSTKQPPLPVQPPLTGTPISRQPPFSQEPLISSEPTLSRGALTTRDPGQASTLGQEGEPLGPPTHVEVHRMPPEETCVYVNREKVGASAAQSSSIHRLLSWQHGSSPKVQEKQLSLIAITAPSPSCKVLPMVTVDTQLQGPQFKLTTEDMTHSPVVAHLSLLRGACYELVPTMNALAVRSPVLCRHSLGPYQDMAAVVIDTGTGFTKCGLAGEDHVLSVLPSRVQLLQHPVQGQPRYTVPEKQEPSYSMLNRGVISDWDALEVLWQHLFYCRLGVQPEELAVLVADSPISPRTNREKVAEILFERFHVPAMQTVHQALLALYAYGRTTGLVLGSGHGTSYVAPIVTGDLAPLDTYRLDVAGCDLTEHLAQLLLAGGQSPLKAELVNQIKETWCYVAMDMKAELARMQSQTQVDFVLPDKQVITLGSERFCCPEALFQPNLLGVNQPGLPQLALLSISRLEAKQQEQLLANVVLDGGSTLLTGFPERLRQELGPRTTVLGSPHRAVAAWLGGSIMASRNSFQSLWFSRREYDEEGPWAIYKYHL
ncbi:uncharacterized protein LOC113880458 [Bos indicus x Bos taurus]|uniref:Uncharacterized LOC113880458 n=1 Tax=Bos indicus x Bos taurus TaxID=30522 RepID=A0A4W2FIT1_BOBOX|nr:uncharacterized protein LOC113880458 [Bos indicus x Bos taurus]